MGLFVSLYWVMAIFWTMYAVRMQMLRYPKHSNFGRLALVAITNLLFAPVAIVVATLGAHEWTKPEE